MNKELEKEIKQIIKKRKLDCTVDNFRKNDSNIWSVITFNEDLSENFMREFQNEIDWGHVSLRRKVSDNFVEEFKDKINWNLFPCHRNLSEDFIYKFEEFLPDEIKRIEERIDNRFEILDIR